MMKKLLTSFFALAGFAILTGCTGSRVSGAYSVRAYAPHNPGAVKVKVSTSTQNIYVLEGDRLLMAVQSCVGANGTTPLGNHTIFSKLKTKRSGSYGFHEGFVWSEPRTHGCIRMHKEAAARFFQLVRIGTPVNIAITQPEDKLYGHLVRKLDQRNDPDPPPARL